MEIICGVQKVPRGALVCCRPAQHTSKPAFGPRALPFSWGGGLTMGMFVAKFIKRWTMRV